MWKYTASRYRNNPVVVGYDLMVEPNANHVWLDLWDPEQFYSQYSGTLYDWNQLFPRIIQGIRAVDPNTPLLVGRHGLQRIVLAPLHKARGGHSHRLHSSPIRTV